MKDKEKQIEEMAYLLTQYEQKLCERLPKNQCLLTSKIHAQVSCDYCKIAEYLINLGYQKVDKDSVVLDQEELNKKYVSIEMYELAKAFHDEKCAEFEKLCYDYEKLKQQLKEAQEFWKATVRTEQEAHKETAREILHKVLSFVGSNQKFWLVDDESITIIDANNLFDFLYELSKQHGVDLEDGVEVEE